MIIAIAIINSLTDNKITLSEVLFTNFIIVLATYLLEKVFLLKHESRKVITYEKIENIKPDNHSLLIEDLKDILAREERRMQIIIDELIEIKDKYGDERRSEIEYAGGDFSIEDMIPDEEVVVTISHLGYMKRT